MVKAFNPTLAERQAADREYREMTERVRNGLSEDWQLSPEAAQALIDERKFVTKDSGQREEFSTGAKRDVQAGKPRYDLISVPALRRLAELMGRGAIKYGDRNWEKGMPISRYYASALRHLMEFSDPDGDPSEDHLAAVLFNVMAIMHMQSMVEHGALPEDLIDME